MTAPVRLAYLVSHPIQYQAPLLRRIAQEPDIELTVLFGSDFSARGYQDRGFGVEVAWDVPLLEGYRYRVLPALRDNGTVSAVTPLSRSLLRALRDGTGAPAFDALWVHGYASLNSLRAMIAARMLGMPVLLRAESWDGDRKRSAAKLAAKRVFFRGLRSLVTATLPIGSRNATYWTGALGSDLKQFPMPYAVDNSYFAHRAEVLRAERTALRQKLGLEAERPVVLFASKLQRRKCANDLLRAAAVLRQQHGLQPYLLIAGDGQERGRLEQLAGELDLTEAVRFLGFQNQSALPELFALADVFVLPSRDEPWGLVVNEAMASGCAVIVSSAVGAAPDLVVDGENGFLFTPGDIDALALTLFLSLGDPETPRHLGRAAAERMASWDFEADVRGLRQALAFSTRRLRP